jgi:hypothetical protein
VEDEEWSGGERDGRRHGHDRPWWERLLDQLPDLGGGGSGDG